MTMMVRFRTAIVAAAAAVGCGALAADAAAQTITPAMRRPAQGPFAHPQDGNGLDVSVFTFEGVDADQIGLGSGLPDSRTQTSSYGAVDLDVTGRWKSRHVLFDAAEQSKVRYYRELGDLVGVRHQVMFDGGVQFDRTRVKATQLISYEPFYAYSTLPDLFETQPADAPRGASQLLLRRPATVIESSGEVSQTLGRATLSLYARTQRTDFEQGAGNDLRADTVSARVVYHLSRDLGLVAAYNMNRGQYGFDSPVSPTVPFRSIEVGLDFDHALSLTRRTTLAFTAGTTAVGNATGAPEYRLVADVRLNREIGRTWRATASFHRGISLIAGYGQPLFSNAVQAGLGGSLNRRVTLWTIGGFAVGELTGVTTENGTRDYSASARVQYALTRTLALSGEYNYYEYRFDRPGDLPVGLGQHLARHSMQIGLVVWLPLVH
jgi:hypothetical protein